MNLGEGPEAIALAKMGYSVTATDNLRSCDRYHLYGVKFGKNHLNPMTMNNIRWFGIGGLGYGWYSTFQYWKIGK